MNHTRIRLISCLKVLFGCILFSLGFNIFLVPNNLNAGGLSGLSMIIVRLIRFGSVGMFTAFMNIPLFVIAGIKIGKRFLAYSVLGTFFSAVFIDLFSRVHWFETDPLIGCIYGGAVCGLGLGLVFSSGASTGGSDIIVRLFKRKWKNVPIGTITMCFDALVAILTGLVFRNVKSTLYSGISIFVSGLVVDAVVYRFDYSRVALIISSHYETIAKRIASDLGRGATYLQGEGSYKGTCYKIVLTAVKRQQLSELKALVADIDMNAFVIVQEAHQVLGDGFLRYTKDSL